MKSADLYAMPTIGRDSWTWSRAMEAMFDEPDVGTWGGNVVEESLPISIETKVEAFDEAQGRGLVQWQVVSWQGVPFGIVVCSEHHRSRVVTDRGLYREAYVGLVALHLPDLDEVVVEAGADTDLVRHAGGQVLVGAGDRMRAVPNRMTMRGAEALDPVELSRRIGEAHGLGAGATLTLEGADLDVLGDAVLASLSTDLRRTREFDLSSGVSASDAILRGWPGVLVANDEGTYVACVDAYDVRKPVTQAAKLVRLGDPGRFDRFVTGDVFEPGETVTPTSPKP